jgi:dephospho-CoA kinase
VLRVGLTGGIACGKSHVLRRLAARGLATLDLDAVAHALMAPGGAAHADVVAAFGPGILGTGGTIDRRALGATVYADPSARARLDSLVHPRVRTEEARRAAAWEAEGCAALVSDAALLVEAGAHLRFDRLVVVHCPPAEQLRRLVERDGLTEAAARARIAAQMPVTEKRRFAHVALDTSGTVAETEAAADRLAQELREVAARPRPATRPGLRSTLGALVHGAGPGPRGLEPAALAAEAVRTDGFELGACARLLRPSAGGPWYRAAAEGEGAPWPEALAGILAIWSLARGLDEEWLASAAASLARLTHAEGPAVAAGCLAALLARDVACGLPLGRLGEGLAQREPQARRWGEAPPPERIAAAVAAASAHPADPSAVRRAAEAAGAEPAFAGALAGLVAGVSAEGSDGALVDLARRLAGERGAA